MARLVVGAMRVLAVLALPPSTVYAAGNFGQSLAGVSGQSWIGWALLSSLIGVTSLLNRIAHELADNGGHIANLPLFVGAHMFGSWSAGLFALFVGESAGAPGFATALGIIAASFGGAAVLQRWSDKYLQQLGDAK